MVLCSDILVRSVWSGCVLPVAPVRALRRPNKKPFVISRLFHLHCKVYLKLLWRQNESALPEVGQARKLLPALWEKEKQDFSSVLAVMGIFGIEACLNRRWDVNVSTIVLVRCPGGVARLWNMMVVLLGFSWIPVLVGWMCKVLSDRKRSSSMVC